MWSAGLEEVKTQSGLGLATICSCDRLARAQACREFKRATRQRLEAARSEEGAGKRGGQVRQKSPEFGRAGICTRGSPYINDDEIAV